MTISSIDIKGASATVPQTQALAALEKHFGHRRFLEGQDDIVEALLAGRDALAILPTGGGKSLCYQLPALMLPGVTVVVSPLIALMKDQVDALERRGIPATMINSTVPAEEQRARIDGLRQGKWKLVYVAPERFRQRAFTDALAQAEIALLAVDEAHCISQWGHDFRPDYMRLGEALARLGSPQTAAFTATATPEVREDILRQLKLRAPFIGIRGFERPNLSLNVTPCPKIKDKYGRLQAVIEEHKTGIIYCSTRVRVEEVYAQLQEWSVSATCYHAGMPESERAAAQELFIRRKKDVVVATNAFGMGIDRSDVRFVVHFELPGSLEAYYQEAGRAGRDGAPGRCELLFNYADTRTQEFFIEGSNPGVDMIRSVYHSLLKQQNAEHRVLASIEQIAALAEAKNEMAVSSALSTLSRSGYIERYDVPGQRIRGTRLLQPQVTARDLTLDCAALEEKERRDRGRLQIMVRFASVARCRQRFILEYFGEETAENCENCDVCRSGLARGSAREATESEMILIRKALSGVARCCHRRGETAWEGRFGRGKIAAMLAGSQAKEITGAGLDRLSTYGILKEQGASWIQALLRELEAAQLLNVSSGEYPLMSLTPRGESVMKSGGRLRLNWPSPESSIVAEPARSAYKSRSAKSSPVSSAKAKGAAGKPAPGEDGWREPGFDEALFSKLRVKRLELAAAAGVQPFAVFSNQTLEFLTRLKPASCEAGLRIQGVDAAKAGKYLQAFVNIINAHTADETPVAGKEPAGKGKKPKVWKL